jgi:holliday junction resolvase Hjr
MTRYQKGASAERELLNSLYDKGFAVIRAAGSGVNALGPDIVVLKNNVAIAFECKSGYKSGLSIEEEQYKKITEWAERTTFPIYVAWKITREGWFFILPNELRKTEHHRVITPREARAINRSLEAVL